MDTAKKEKKWGITGTGIKLIAFVSMLIDHIGVVLLGQHLADTDSIWYQLPWSTAQMLSCYSILREIGRLAFPLFCFLLVEGAMYTSNRVRYLCNMLVFAVLSEVPFDLALHGQILHWDSQNVFWTLALGLVAIYACDHWQMQGLFPWLSVIACGLVAYVLRVDYGFAGVVLMVFFWLFRFQPLARALMCSAWLIFGIGLHEAAGSLAFIPIYFCNGKRGWAGRVKYLFYLFYPLHLLLLYGIGQWI